MQVSFKNEFRLSSKQYSHKKAQPHKRSGRMIGDDMSVNAPRSLGVPEIDNRRKGLRTASSGKRRSRKQGQNKRTTYDGVRKARRIAARASPAAD